MKKFTILFLALAFNSVSGQIIFECNTAVDEGNSVTETIDGIILTASADVNVYIINNFGTMTGPSVFTSGTTGALTFTFNQPVAVNSISPLEGWNQSLDFVFTPTGGNNSVVTTSLFQGNRHGDVIDLNWVDVSSFTITALNPPYGQAQIGFDNLSVTSNTFPVVFDWDTAPVDNGDNVTETIDGITATVSGVPDLTFDNLGGTFGSSANVVISGGGAGGTTDATSITFSFNVPVNVVSILAMDGNGSSIDYTFTPTGGSNSPVVQSLSGGFATANLNWTDVTSFTVTSTGSWFAFDNLNLTVSNDVLSVADEDVPQKAFVYPNPVENTLYIKNSLDLKSIYVYNHLGQLVLQSKEATIDVRHLSQGLYVLQIHTSQGIETKRIIKK
ncbi:MAG TPA: T9SS type A sorting domain-containing protein [Flavobacteriaceae bacterium]